ncbi:hypothetical protein RESH_00750 [Rhodopirellula europaea SH398]|jgi:hypothetical protein|uniref:Uncharacterized protein n=2 Tax=Rhodopirellula europaea TaxID=1263866 RepID=M2B9K3_9BACT|nr:hypothetical protein RE6C_00472 [Rhodopirellula europaea 6C]EMI28648.1 hypothetical protein RESH_00750 [Rhodopirellula europaea SH398]
MTADTLGLLQAVLPDWFQCSREPRRRPLDIESRWALCRPVMGRNEP